MDWAELIKYGAGALVALGALAPVIYGVFKKAKKDGALEAAKTVPAVLAANHEMFAKFYKQFKGVVKAVEAKETATQDVIANLTPAERERLRETSAAISGVTLDGTTLPAIDVAGIAFRDIVNNKLIKESEVNDEILKSLVTSAKHDESASQALNKVSGIAGAVVGESLNIGAKIASGGTVDAKDVLGFISGVGSTALGAKRRE